ncbi:spermidine synthase [Pseudoalteromonas luteoviolacea]|uniref:PABS domain-containing protein n=1 Tax=Pseudoalteromonas luteoviolacea S4054 TaxID=1129367 RepID=A0A0F6A6W0_9GAMM|nr:methyltransferase domain-containing protein [Pseudoalteromonas luteoviolacea]AOT07743.1 hypothetical protein S4054249_07760 [Pseudoalteromonas luteoviolacea]AOT12659.1 hypothetical protein S40542_07760 [Pseudoalteromonas luteoviolacea]AOT17572.1 hypothetical protein S4054_07755 [Pseudoalteromonas luteoviolacea]KKE81591.1 hypothetical protein N479_22095 [Pseudoalteromonas luteoviolacea S4054]KZN78873.1 hypothetical protein N481_00090 [Pseudoalteromonas luteoviolacea S4047-1]
MENNTLRWFNIDGIMQSAMSISEPSSLVFPHMLFMAIPTYEITTVNRVLDIGLGGGGLLRFLRDKYPQAHIEAVEKSQHIIDLYRQFFNPNEIESVIHCKDAHAFVTQQTTTLPFDLIVVDIFDSETLLPFIFESQFYSNLKDLVAKKGWIALNTVFTKREQISKLSDVLTKIFPDTTIYGFKAAQFANIVWVIATDNQALNPIWQQQAFFSTSKIDGLTYLLDD